MTLSPVYFTVAGRYRSVVADAASDANTDPEIGAVSATVTFEPLIATGDVILASQAAPRPTGFLAAPIVALIDPTDGLLKLRTTQDAGASGGLGYVPVRLLADTAVLELNGPLYYRVTFTDVVYNNGARGAINSFTFQAPNSDLELDLITVSTGPSQVAAGLTKVAPTGVRYDPAGSGSIIFTVAGVDIPDPIPVSVLRGPTGASGASGGTGGTGAVGATGASGIPGASGTPGASGIPGVSGIPGLVGATGPVGATGASGASGGTGGTGLAGQSVSLKGSVATYSLLPGSATVGDGYISLADNLLYVWNGSWPAEGAGVPFVGPAGASGTPGASGSPGASGASGVPGLDGASGTPGLAGASGVPGATGPTGATGASGGTGGTGGTGAPGASGASGAAGISRSISTLTTNSTTLSAAANTDYAIFTNIATTPEVPSTGDASYPSTVALLHGDGSNNATSPITDNSAAGVNWTAYDGAKLSTDQKKFGTASIFFDGTDDYVQVASSPGWGSGAYTVEMWLYPTAVTGATRFFYYEPGFRLLISTSGQISVLTSSSANTSGGSLSANTWSHVALSRSGTDTRLFLNGTQVGSTITDNINHTTATRTLGQFPGIGGFYQGYIDEVRLTSAARYTTNFTAPTAAFPDFGTPTIPAVPPEVTLPSAVSNSSLYLLQNVGSETLTVKTTSSQTINGSSTYSLTATSTVRLLSNQTNWRIV